MDSPVETTVSSALPEQGRSAAVWVGGPVILLVLGLIHLLRQARPRWWSAACWLIMLVVGGAIGFLIMHGHRLLLSAYPTDTAGEPLGPSRWAPSGPYWLALAAAAGELAVGAVLIALVRQKRSTPPLRMRIKTIQNGGVLRAARKPERLTRGR